MYREISEKLKSWKHDNNKKPLIIIGARQVGKTYSVREFAHENYQSILEIDLQENIDAREFFTNAHKIEDIIAYLEINYSNVTLNKNALVFFDEIQLCPELITSLKYFSEKSSFDIICSGSMLGVKLWGISSFPVGYVDMLTMFPMTFTEFIIANQIPDKYIEEAKERVKTKKEISLPVHEKLSQLFSDYVICGGMPEAVNSYLSEGIAKAVSVCRRLIRDYEMDIAHYADSKTKIKALECFQSLPLQLAKDNKKFQYKLVREGYNARHYDESLAWLSNAGLINRVYRLKKIDEPLEINKEIAIFKAYLFDTGLLAAQFSDGIVHRIKENTLGVYKGVVYENITAQIFFNKGIKAYYYEPNSSSEIDFVIEHKGEIVPVEVKGGLHTRSISFNNFIKNHDSKKAFRFSQKNVGVSDDGVVEYMPYYAMEWLL